MTFICSGCGTKHKIYGDLKKNLCISCDEKQMKREPNFDLDEHEVFIMANLGIRPYTKPLKTKKKKVLKNDSS